MREEGAKMFDEQKEEIMAMIKIILKETFDN